MAVLTAGAVFAGLAAAVAALVPYLIAPQPPLEPYQRDPSTPVVQLRDGRNISYQVLCGELAHILLAMQPCCASRVIVNRLCDRVASCETQVYGDPNGKHLSFWLHGTPSCRLEAHGLSEKVLKQLSIKVSTAPHS